MNKKIEKEMDSNSEKSDMEQAPLMRLTPARARTLLMKALVEENVQELEEILSYLPHGALALQNDLQKVEPEVPLINVAIKSEDLRLLDRLLRHGTDITPIPIPAGSKDRLFLAAPSFWKELFEGFCLDDQYESDKLHNEKMLKKLDRLLMEPRVVATLNDIVSGHKLPIIEALKGSPAAFERLLKAGANPHLLNAEGASLLDALWAQHEDGFQEYSKSTAQVMKEGFLAKLRLMIQAGFLLKDEKAGPCSNWDWLEQSAHVVMELGVPLIDLWVEEGVDLHQQTSEGNTLLSIAGGGYSHDEPVVIRLLELGLNPMNENKAGDSFWCIYRMEQGLPSEEIVKLMINATPETQRQVLLNELLEQAVIDIEPKQVSRLLEWGARATPCLSEHNGKMWIREGLGWVRSDQVSSPVGAEMLELLNAFYEKEFLGTELGSGAVTNNSADLKVKARKGL